MEQVEVKILNKTGLHARSAALFVQVANKFRANIRIKKEKQEVNGKSILSVMMIAAAYGTKITIKAKGKDEKIALAKLKELVESKFGER